ncbi:Acetylornithine deacetylase/Succinyl-diaminopimelate desuccinylase [Georgenia satyanarayanai]|uniref:Acetylornithine deacetylase/Succinyl-diaminopimelate desuccinylase n=1 Tax=Georgenia satyanarayanai TaxID=860221 RepID=A0A2Y8ZWU4_9MICO|nr:dipeptidase [Georgenia satyanarayanai]PYG01988.1 acetylornithine deacetylase/succinyl-diaminopimelate desuccinylase-like protein [Georgenia satyanarayanai]SSA36791.1 Acetylornithine deacetylase/Succinyl-diaminopimelate desuccinylase [Georgenia satyanarayanai]
MTIEDLTTRTAAEFPSIRSDLESLVRIPSVSAPAFDAQHLEDSAAAVAQLFRDAGLPEVEVVRVTGPDGRPGAPAVLAHRPAPAGAPTVLLYAHHDVQPPGDAAAWTSAPFEPTERDGRLYGRGAADDKAGIMAHVGALRVLGDELGVGVTVFSEGEEEIGSPTFRTFLETYLDRLAADVIVVADSSNWKVGVPGLTTSLRGLVDCTVELTVLDHAVHSGMFGGPVLDALTLMSRLVATLHDDDGNVAVPGLVATDHAAVDYPEADFRADAGVLDGVRLAGTGPLAARLWTKPAISLIGLDATSVDHSSNTVIPAARAKLSMRIAPGQDPAAAERALHDHLVTNAPFGARVTVTPGETGQAFQAPEDSAAMQAARWAFTTAWGTEPVDLGVGGSIPFIADLAEVYPEAAILVTGVEDPDSRAHSENESVHLGELEKVVLAEALLLARLADRL